MGNYTVSLPEGAPVTFLIFNDTEFTAFTEHQNATPALRGQMLSNSPIVFHTDTFHFVWMNDVHPVGWGIALTATTRSSSRPSG